MKNSSKLLLISVYTPYEDDEDDVKRPPVLGWKIPQRKSSEGVTNVIIDIKMSNICVYFDN